MKDGLKIIIILLFVNLNWLATWIEGKTVSGKFLLESGDLTHGPEYEITKFSFAIGKGRVQGKVSYLDPHTWMTSPALYLFRDESWNDYHKAPACDDKMMFAFKAIPIGQVCLCICIVVVLKK